MFLCINTCPMNEAITRLYGIMDKSDSSVPVFNGKNIFSSIMNGSSEFNTYGNFDAIFSPRGSRFKFADFGIKNFTEWADDCVWQGESGIRILDMRSPNWLTIIDNNGNVYAYTPKVYGNAKNISRDKVVLARFDVSSHSTFCNVKPLTFTVNRAFSWEAARNFVVFQDLDDYKIGDNVMVDGRILAVVSKELLPKNNSTEKTPTYTAVNINTDASKNYKYSPYNKGDIITIYPESESLTLPAGTYINHMGKSVTYQATTTITRYPFKLRSTKDNNTDDPVATFGSSWVVDEPWAVVEEGSNMASGEECSYKLFCGGNGEDFTLGKHSGMSVGSTHIVAVNTPVVADSVICIESYTWGQPKIIADNSSNPSMPDNRAFLETNGSVRHVLLGTASGAINLYFLIKRTIKWY